ncbi:hypothetical protein LSCM1_04967 [Leishmania martiniquensis]|uniref:TFIIS central domain-containing protein n=1 Tax=Leishmania martiniquensis TaxID=1580590 RepID=A0A836GPL2_9TRYP|nr:hypothetical protein LSCM1_04967 [Leishmania martiniquensis]
MSGSEWSSESGASDAERNASSALNIHLVELLTSSHLPRATYHRRALTTGDGAWAAFGKIIYLNPAKSESPHTQSRIDLRGLIQQALSQSRTRCPSVNADDMASRVAAALIRNADGAEMARAVTHALADPLNEKLRESVLTGRLRPEDLVALDEVSLLSEPARAALEKGRLERLNQQSVENLERLSLSVTNMFTCPECGARECYANFRSTDFVKW